MKVKKYASGFQLPQNIIKYDLFGKDWLSNESRIQLWGYSVTKLRVQYKDELKANSQTRNLTRITTQDRPLKRKGIRTLSLQSEVYNLINPVMYYPKGVVIPKLDLHYREYYSSRYTIE